MKYKVYFNDSVVGEVEATNWADWEALQYAQNLYGDDVTVELQTPKTINGTRHGDYVTSAKHGYSGRAYKFSFLTNKDAEWVAAQNTPLTIEEIRGRFVSILIHEGGAVMVPESSITIIDPIKDFAHPFRIKHFPKG